MGMVTSTILRVRFKKEKRGLVVYSRVLSANLLGLECEKVWAEVCVENGLSNFSIVGLANQAIKESKDRVRAAIENCGFEFPDTRITVNLTTAWLKKEGSHFDLAIAIGILLSSGMMVPENSIEDVAFLGELTLDGKIEKVNGLLPMIIGLRRLGVRRYVIPQSNLAEAGLVKDIEVLPASHLNDIISYIGGDSDAEFVRPVNSTGSIKPCYTEDFADIRGQELIKRAALIAAAGFHGMLIIGPPGVGKSMVGKRIPGILPELTYEQQLEVTQVYSIAGKLSAEHPIITERPFRSPHRGATQVAMIGGGKPIAPGEVTLAHQGVLFLDELAEFPSSVIESLRQPMEDGKVSIVRADGRCEFPAKFMVVAAMNPCKCGYFGDPEKKCSCTQSDRVRYLNRVSGPLLDRIDLHISAQRPSYTDMEPAEGNRIIDSASMRAKVIKAIEIQKERYKGSGIDSNSSLNAGQIQSYCVIDSEGKNLLSEAFTSWHLSARAYHKVIKLSRTIADLDESSEIKKEHVLEALSYRLPEKYFAR